MFKSGRWKAQNKLKVMFQLQFQATQVPKVKGKGLMVALIPADIGKPTAKLEKTPVVEGTCTWEDPIYEMVKLVKNQKTETYKEKIYYFNVQSGSSRGGFVGEVGVDFANFAEANEPFQLSLPLTASESGAILHVFIQKMQRTDEQSFRESEENESESIRSKNQASDSSENGNILDFAEDERKNSKSLNKNGEKEKHLKQRSSNDWSMGSLSDKSISELLNSPEENDQEQRLYTESSKNEAEVLRSFKSEISRLERQAEMSDLELDSLRKQMVKENKREQDLTRAISELKVEKLALEEENSATKEEIKRLYADVELQKREKEEMKTHIDDITLDYKYLLQEHEDMSSKLAEAEIENANMKHQVKRLEEKIMDQASEISNSFDTISEFETHIKRLEKELEKQGHDFEEDVEDLMKAKMEQEQRVVDAEEALRETRLINASVVEKLNEERESFALLKKETEKLKKESMNSENLMSEKNVIIQNLQSELKMLRSDYHELQERFYEIESEKVNLQKEVKESKRGVGCDVSSSKSAELLSEISSLEEKNKDMESELKEMQEKYSEISLRFAEVEGERSQLVMTLRNLRNGKKR